MQTLIKLAAAFEKLAQDIPTGNRAWNRIDAAVRSLLLGHFGNLYTSYRIGRMRSDNYTIYVTIVVPYDQYQKAKTGNAALNAEIPGFLNDEIQKVLRTNYRFEVTLLPEPQRPSQQPSQQLPWEQHFRPHTPAERKAFEEWREAFDKYGPDSPESKEAEERYFRLSPRSTLSNFFSNTFHEIS